jgi:head-tail adaptor
VDESFRARRHRITIERTISTRNTCGEVLYHWEFVCRCWAEIRDNTITIRYQPDLLPGYRVVIGASYFEIVGVVDIKEPTRLVRLEVKELGHGRACPVRSEDEQQNVKGFPWSATNTGERKIFRHGY